MVLHEFPLTYFLSPRGEEKERMLLLHIRVGAVVVDALEILRFYGEPGDVGVGRKFSRHLPHHVLHEHGVVIGLLGDVLFIGALEDGVDVAAR